MSGEHEPQTGAAARIDERDDFAAWQTENILDSALGQGPGYCFRVRGHELFIINLMAPARLSPGDFLRRPCYDGTGGLSMGPVGVQEMVVIFLVALVLFGPK